MHSGIILPWYRSYIKTSAVQTMLNDRNKRFDDGKNCSTTECLIDALKWKDSEISILNNKFQDLYVKNKTS